MDEAFVLLGLGRGFEAARNYETLLCVKRIDEVSGRRSIEGVLEDGKRGM